MDRVAPRVADRQTALAAIIQINIVHPGSGDGDQFEFRQAGKLRLAQGELIANCDGGILQSFNYLAGIRLAVVNPLMREVRPAKVGPEGAALQKDNAFHKREGRVTRPQIECRSRLKPRLLSRGASSIISGKKN